MPQQGHEASVNGAPDDREDTGSSVWYRQFGMPDAIALRNTRAAIAKAAAGYDTANRLNHSPKQIKTGRRAQTWH